jgi:hypothetical protein
MSHRGITLLQEHLQLLHQKYVLRTLWTMLVLIFIWSCSQIILSLSCNIERGHSAWVPNIKRNISQKSTCHFQRM